MDKPYIKDVMYGGISELMRNSRYYYRSTVGIEYSKWTDEGREAILALVESTSRDIHKVEIELELKRSKELMVKGLKGEQL